jgi:hypothetical protein
MNRNDRPDEHVSEEEAAELWKRAAQLQAEAARRAEIAARREATDELTSVAGMGSSEGYAVTHVRAAAVEAGIGEEFVDAALADLRVERALGSEGRGGLARRFLGNPDDAVTASRVINAPVPDVLEAMEAVLPSEPFNLTLKDRRGDPAAGDLLVFDIPGASMTGVSQPGFPGQASHADLREIYASLRPMGEAACELTMRSPVAWAYGMNAGIGALITGAGAGIGLGGGSALAAVLGGMTAMAGMATLSAIVATVAVVGGVVAGGSGAHWFFRKLYAFAIDKGDRALEAALGAVAMRAEGGWGFAPKALPGEGGDSE